MRLSGKISRYNEEYLLIKTDDIDPDELFKRIYKCGDRCEIRLLDKRLISREQQKKIYAIFGEVAQFMGEIDFGGVDYVKNMLKGMFLDEQPEFGWFSLGSCSVETAREFIDFLIGFCLEHSIQTQDTLLRRCEDIERYMYQCLKHKKCAICNEPGEVHHVDAIGMGNNRITFNDLLHRKICLCRKHRGKAHEMGWTDFAAYWHVVGILFNENKED